MGMGNKDLAENTDKAIVVLDKFIDDVKGGLAKLMGWGSWAGDAGTMKAKMLQSVINNTDFGDVETAATQIASVADAITALNQAIELEKAASAAAADPMGAVKDLGRTCG